MNENTELDISVLKYLLTGAEANRKEAIYDYTYSYIKEIIFDDVANEHYGNTRTGYEKFNSNEKSVSYSGENSLRTVTVDSEIVGYVLETKRKVNEPLLDMKKSYDDAKEEVLRLLEVKDREAFLYWLDERYYVDPFQANSYTSGIKDLIMLVADYQEDEDLRKLIDKIKG